MLYFFNISRKTDKKNCYIVNQVCF